MRMKMLAVTATLCIASPLIADPVSVTFSPVQYDVWVYPPGSGGLSDFAPTFASPFGSEDPDRLGYFMLVFDTSSLMTDRPARLLSITTRVPMLNSSNFSTTNGMNYDPTRDSFLSALDPLLDEDPGRPVELFAVGFNNGLSASSWNEQLTPVLQNGVYNAIPLDFPGAGPRDVQESVDMGFDPMPLAVGTTPDTYLAPSDGTPRVANGAIWSFDADLTGRDDAQAYLGEQLFNEGRLPVILSSLHAAGFGGMGGSQVYPRFATNNTFFPVPDAELDAVYEISPPADVDTNFRVDIEDLYAYELGEGLLDANGDNMVNAQDRELVEAGIREDQS